MPIELLQGSRHGARTVTSVSLLTYLETNQRVGLQNKRRLGGQAQRARATARPPQSILVSWAAHQSTDSLGPPPSTCSYGMRIRYQDWRKVCLKRPGEMR